MVCGLERNRPRTDGRVVGASSDTGVTVSTGAADGAEVTGASSSTIEASVVVRPRDESAGLGGLALVVRLVGAGVVVVVVVVFVVVDSTTAGVSSTRSSSTNASYSLKISSCGGAVVVDPPLLFRMLTTAVLRLKREGLGLDGNSIGSSSATVAAAVDVGVVEVVVGDVVLDRAGLVPVALSAAFGLLGRGAGVVTGATISSSNTASSTYSSSNGAVVVVDVVDILGRRKRLLGGGGGVDVVVVVVAITSSPNGISPST